MSPISDAQLAEHCRRYELKNFLELAELLGNDIAAAKALRAEGEFILSEGWVALNAPRTPDFAAKVRTFMVENKLSWNNHNLLSACQHVLDAKKTLETEKA